MKPYLISTPVGTIAVKTNLDLKYEFFGDLISAQDIVSITIKFYHLDNIDGQYLNKYSFDDTNLSVKAPIHATEYIINKLSGCTNSHRRLYISFARSFNDIITVSKICSINFQLIELHVDLHQYKRTVIDLFAIDNYYTELRICDTDKRYRYELEQVNSRNRSLRPENVHKYTLDIAIVFAQLLQTFGPYLLLEIIDWTNPYYHMFNHKLKISILQKVYDRVTN